MNIKCAFGFHDFYVIDSKTRDQLCNEIKTELVKISKQIGEQVYWYIEFVPKDIFIDVRCKNCTVEK